MGFLRYISHGYVHRKFGEGFTHLHVLVHVSEGSGCCGFYAGPCALASLVTSPSLELWEQSLEHYDLHLAPPIRIVRQTTNNPIAANIPMAAPSIDLSICFILLSFGTQSVYHGRA